MRNPLPLAVVALALASSVSPAGAVSVVGIDAMTSTVFYHGQSSFSGWALRGRLQPPSLIKEIEVMPTFEYWRNTIKLQPYDIHASRKDATLGVDVRYDFTISNWKPFLGAGWGVHFLSSAVDAPALGIRDADSSVIMGSLAALGGVTFTISDRIDNFFELKYHPASGYEQTKLNWGLSYKLGPLPAQPAQPAQH